MANETKDEEMICGLTADRYAQPGTAVIPEFESPHDVFKLWQSLDCQLGYLARRFGHSPFGVIHATLNFRFALFNPAHLNFAHLDGSPLLGRFIRLRSGLAREQ